MARPYRIFDHTADIGIRATGPTREELFANCARALTSVICDLRRIRGTLRRTIAVTEEAGDATHLLVRFLAEVLYVTEADGILLRRFRVSFPHPARVSAEAYGEPMSDRHTSLREVKAVTYHQAKVVRRGPLWHAQVILDI